MWLDTITEWGDRQRSGCNFRKLSHLWIVDNGSEVIPPPSHFSSQFPDPKSALQIVECFKSMLHLYEKGWLLKRSQRQFRKVYLDFAHSFRMPLSPCNHISDIGWLPSAEHCSSYNLEPRVILAPCQRYDRQIMTSGRIDLFNFSDWLFRKQ